MVFDEADRLFEMGLGDQLREILARLPDTRYRRTANIFGCESSPISRNVCSLVS